MVVVNTWKFEIFTLSFGGLYYVNEAKCEPHVQHDYFSSFNQSDQCHFWRWRCSCRCSRQCLISLRMWPHCINGDPIQCYSPISLFLRNGPPGARGFRVWGQNYSASLLGSLTSWYLRIEWGETSLTVSSSESFQKSATFPFFVSRTFTFIGFAEK